ncbi:MAG: cyclase family protein [Bdellovibrionales bacterium]|nr:cyclase family protein [Bdellovibrionales bacterium]
MKYYDISPLISDRIGVFPGDQPFERTVTMSVDDGQHMGLSAIQSTLHLGAHADAPNHYGPAQSGIDQVPVDRYLGKCQVITAMSREGRIYPEGLSSEIEAPRVLFKTNSFPDPDQWNSDFVALSPELIRWAHKKGVFLFGIDTPSVDPESSKKLESHQALLETKSAVLEGLVLTEVPDGVYYLSALPLRIENADASPVRAVLWSTTDSEFL